ncbi:MAG: hypothetical protein PHH67_10420 [Methanosarcina sp.]|nr:hypothetical protein [Methanosarcina sp.]MDD4306899.1 hypothetical protein [Methanosarcina sp.]
MSEAKRSEKGPVLPKRNSGSGTRAAELGQRNSGSGIRAAELGKTIINKNEKSKKEGRIDGYEESVFSSL